MRKEGRLRIRGVPGSPYSARQCGCWLCWRRSWLLQRPVPLQREPSCLGPQLCCKKLCSRFPQDCPVLRCRCGRRRVAGSPGRHSSGQRPRLPHGRCKLHLDLRDQAGATDGAGMLQPLEVPRASEPGPRQAEGKDLTRDACVQSVHGLSTDGCQHHREAPLHSAMGQMWPPSPWGPLPHPGSQPHQHLAKAGCWLRPLEPGHSFRAVSRCTVTPASQAPCWKCSLM